MSTPFETADRYVDDLVEQLPTLATTLGIPGHDHRWPDLGPEGRAAVADVHRRARDAMAVHHHDPDPDQALAAAVVHRYAESQVTAFEQGDHLRDLSHMMSSIELFRDTFDMMDPTTDAGLEPIIHRLSTVAEPYAGYRRTLAEGVEAGQVVAVRQVRSAVGQLRSLAGDESAYDAIARKAAEAGRASSLLGRLGAAIAVAKAEASAFAAWLEREYLPHATSTDGVGAERYARHTEAFLGFPIDPHETYAWGWAEIADLTRRLRAAAAEIDPDASPAAVMEVLENDPARSADTVEDFLRFVEERLVDALSALNGVHFDVSEPIRAVTVNLAPAGSPPGAYYVEPSEDLVRPGSVWYSVAHKQTFPLYQEVSTAYHEGFPGHHLEIGTARVLADHLSRAQRLLIWYPGFGEGWALYAERLMDELGFFELPEYRFGMLASHIFRAARVVVDIGLHLGLKLPASAPVAGGEPWTRDVAAEFMRVVGMQPPVDAASEVDRYLGWPGQAISYKVGEREILSIRDEVRSRQGSAFDLRGFHTALLSGGNMPLDLLRRRMGGSDRPVSSRSPRGWDRG